MGSTRTVYRDKRPLAADAVVTKGKLAACNADGFYQEATGALDEVVVGRFYDTKTNDGGDDGAVLCDVQYLAPRELLLVANDDGAPVTVAHRERLCSALNSTTATAANAAKANMGVVYDVTTEGVWVEILGGGSFAGQSPGEAPRVQSGTSTLVAGTKTVTGVAITAASRIIVTMKDPGAGAITGLGALDAPVAGRTVGAGTSGQFVVNAIDDSKATITTAVCTFDYVIIG